MLTPRGKEALLTPAGSLYDVSYDLFFRYGF